MNKRRKGALSVIMPWLRRFGFIVVLLFFGVWLGIWLLVSGGMQTANGYVHNKIVAATAAMGFKIGNVLIEGRVHTDPELLKQLIAVEKGTPLFALDPRAVRERIEKAEWIKSVAVERRLPDTVFIRLREHAPLALWQKGNELKLLDEEGGVINTGRLGEFKDLMIVMGDDAPAHAPELLSGLNAEPALAAHVTSAKWLDGRRWDLTTKEGIEIKLPEGDMELALRRLAGAQTADRIFDKDITAIDLREAGRMVVRTRPGALEEYKAQQAAVKGDNI